MSVGVWLKGLYPSLGLFASQWFLKLTQGVVIFTDLVFIGYFMINDAESLQTPAGLGPSLRKARSLLSYRICLSLSVSYVPEAVV